MVTFRWNTATGEVTEMAEKIEEEVLKAENIRNNDLDLPYSYKEMTVKELYRGNKLGPVNQDNGMAIVFEDEFGNRRVGRISFEQLNNTLKEIGLVVRTK